MLANRKASEDCHSIGPNGNAINGLNTGSNTAYNNFNNNNNNNNYSSTTLATDNNFSSIGNANANSNANNPTGNYQNLMLDSLLLRSLSDSLSNDPNKSKHTNEPRETRERVLSFNSNYNNTQPNKHPRNFLNHIKNIYEQKSLTDNNDKHQWITQRLKEINPTPERILDAPSLIDDYYLNLIDWSSSGILAVCLGNSVYLWNGNNFEIKVLMNDNENICSVHWMQNGETLAIGLRNGSVELWDTVKLKKIRKMDGHDNRVCSLSSYNYLLSSGSKDSYIINHDVRMNNSILHKLRGHTQEVCSLEWSPDGNYLASGGNDNLLCIWDVNGMSSNGVSTRSSVNTVVGGNIHNINNIPNIQQNIHPNTQPNLQNSMPTIQNNNLLVGNPNNNSNNNEIPFMRNSESLWDRIQENFVDDEMSDNYMDNDDSLSFNHNINNVNNMNTHSEFSPKYIFTQHDAAVKALAWCPWQKGLLASGGGSKDKTIKFWNVENGSLVNSVNTGSQVCALKWSKHEKELISSHGYSKNQVSLWQYPSMYKITELSGHMSRVLYLSMSPDGNTIVSGAGDETLRFWKIHDPKKATQSDILGYSSGKIMNGLQLR